MPYAKCPNCESVVHLLVTHDVEEWYARNAPGIPRDQLTPVFCLACWKKAREGTLEIERLPVSSEVKANLRALIAAPSLTDT